MSTRGRVKHDRGPIGITIERIVLSWVTKSLVARLEARPIRERAKLGALAGFAVAAVVLTVGGVCSGSDIAGRIAEILMTSGVYAAASAASFAAVTALRQIYRTRSRT